MPPISEICAPCHNTWLIPKCSTLVISEALIAATIQSILEKIKKTLLFIEKEPDKAKVFDLIAEVAKSGMCIIHVHVHIF